VAAGLAGDAELDVGVVIFGGDVRCDHKKTARTDGLAERSLIYFTGVGKPAL